MLTGYPAAAAATAAAAAAGAAAAAAGAAAAAVAARHCGDILLSHPSSAHKQGTLTWLTAASRQADAHNILAKQHRHPTTPRAIYKYKQ